MTLTRRLDLNWVEDEGLLRNPYKQIPRRLLMIAVWRMEQEVALTRGDPAPLFSTNDLLDICYADTA
jgi:hypothetical protein